MSLGNYIKPVKVKDKGQRGKWAEAEVRKVLQEMSDAKLRFAFNRNLDARAAGGKFPAQPGDFQWFYAFDKATTCNGILEVKQTEFADRLPHENFTQKSFNLVNKRELAGSIVTIIVCHYEEGVTKPKDAVWRMLPLERFRDRGGKGVGSWFFEPGEGVVEFRDIFENMLEI